MINEPRTPQVCRSALPDRGQALDVWPEILSAPVMLTDMALEQECESAWVTQLKPRPNNGKSIEQLHDSWQEALSHTREGLNNSAWNNGSPTEPGWCWYVPAGTVGEAVTTARTPHNQLMTRPRPSLCWALRGELVKSVAEVSQRISVRDLVASSGDVGCCN